MKNVIVAIIGVAAVLFIEGKLPIDTQLGSCAFVVFGLALLTIVAMCSKAGGAVLVLGIALATAILVGGCYVPEGYQGWVWGAGLITGATLLVYGLGMVSGIGLCTARQPQPRPHGLLEWRDV